MRAALAGVLAAALLLGLAALPPQPLPEAGEGELGPWAAEGPLVVALRGSRVLSPANSAAAHHAAANLGADLLRADVHALTAGLRVVDAATLAALGPRGRAASSLAEAELDGLDAAADFLADGRPVLRAKGVRMPRLQDWMTRFRALPVQLHLQGRDPAAADALVRALNAFMASTQLEGGGAFAERLEDRLLVSADSLAVAARARAAFEGRVATACAPEEALLMLWAVRWPALWPALDWASPSWRACTVLEVPVQVGSHRFATAAFVEAAHALGKRVVFGVANEEALMRRLLALGADGLLTDRPDVAHALLEQLRPGTGREEARAARRAALGDYEVPLYNLSPTADEPDFCTHAWCPLLRAPLAALAAAAWALLAAALYAALSTAALALRLVRPSAKAAPAKDAAKAKAAAQDVAQAKAAAKAGQEGMRRRK